LFCGLLETSFVREALMGAKKRAVRVGMVSDEQKEGNQWI
jgi:hypothetical protein